MLSFLQDLFGAGSILFVEVTSGFATKDVLRDPYPALLREAIGSNNINETLSVTLFAVAIYMHVKSRIKRA